MASKLNDNVETALKYGKSLVGTPYLWWFANEKGDDSTLHGGAPTYASNDPVPTLKHIRENGCSCTGLINLIRRKLRLPVPGIERNFKYSGGTWIWFHQLKKEKKLEPFDITQKYPKGTLLLRNYTNPNDQGHVAVVFSDNGDNILYEKLLHSYVNDPSPVPHAKVSPGVSIDKSIGKSHFWIDAGYYTHVCLPHNWLI